MIDPLPRQGLITDYNALFGWMATIMIYIPLPFPPLDNVISYNALHYFYRGMIMI